jgi:hypothetical protein
MHIVAESVRAENIRAHTQDASGQHSGDPPNEINLLTLFFRTALYAALLGRPLHTLRK